MICKYCFAELEEDVTVCPVCGKELTEENALEATEEVAETTEVTEELPEEVCEEEIPPVEEPKKAKTWKIVAAVFGVVVLAVLLVGAILHFMGLGKTVLHNLKFWRENDAQYKLSYTVDDKKAEKKSEVIVAKLGDQVLTNGELQAHYWIIVYDYLEYYSYYLSSIGIDPAKPLDEQISNPETGETFQQMFLSEAIESWRRYATLVQMSKEANFTMSAEQQGYLDAVKTQIEKIAAENEYTDVEEFIDKEFFPGSSLASYMKYTELNHVALSYFDTLYESLMPSEEQMEAYYKEHETEFKNNGIAKENGNYYDVRHLLITPTGGSFDENGNKVYADSEWEICRETAQARLDEYLAGEKTETAFANLAAQYSQDTGSSEAGGLYENLTKETNFVEEFKNWYLDESRKPGDTGLIKTEHGYHVMYFVDSRPIWKHETESAMLTDNTDKMLEDAETKWPLDVDYKKIVLGTVKLTAE